MNTERLRIAIIIGSTREGRFGPTVTRWFTEQAAQRDDLELDVIDLAEVDLPAALPSQPMPEVDAYVQRLDAADAFVVITPEYNHGYPASLKQAIDVAFTQWRAKPIGFVCYGGMSGGLRAVEQLRQVFAELHAMTVRDTVSFHGGRRNFDQAGNVIDASICNATAKGMLDQLVWWGHALKQARARHPYAA